MKFHAKGKQTDVMCLNYSNDHVVVGCAGCGKSVCALLRASVLTEMEYDVIVLSFNNNLSGYLHFLSENQIPTITVIKYMKHIIESYAKDKYKLLDKHRPYMKKALKSVADKYPNVHILQNEDLILSELEWMQRTGNIDRDGYRATERIGRNSTRILREQRDYVFDVYEAYIRIREKAGYAYDFNDVGILFNELIEEGVIERKGIQIIIDEGQDFSPVAIRALANYVKGKGCITYFGDSAQQIYGSRYSWKNIGLNVRKVLVLDENYRNSNSILHVCNALRKNMGLDVDDVLEVQDIKADISQKPYMYTCKSNEEEYALIKRSLAKYASKGTTAILLPTNLMCEKLYDSLHKEGFKINKLKSIHSFSKYGNYIGTYHSAKGFEFDSVILPYCITDNFIHCIANTGNDDDFVLSLKKLLYVGISRAKENLVISGSPHVCEYLDEVADLFQKGNIENEKIRG